MFTVEEGAQVSLLWDPNSEPDCEGYKLYYGYASGDYSFSVDVGYQTAYTLTSLQPDKIYYFAATAYNTTGTESDYSNEVTFIGS